LQEKKKIYVGCALTQAPQEFRDSVESLKDALREEFEILDFIGLVGGTATDVYHYDIHHCTAKCEMFLAICDFPSIGLGYELSFAIEKRGIKTLAVAHKDAKITRLVLGIDAPRFEFRRYEDILEVADMVRARMDELVAV
jgi:hypothetical protein